MSEQSYVATFLAIAEYTVLFGSSKSTSWAAFLTISLKYMKNVP